MFKSLFYIDIETVSKYKDFEEFKLYNPKGSEIFENKAATQYNYDYNINEYYKNKAGLIPEYGKIVCFSFGYLTSTSELKIKTKHIKDDDELSLLKDIKEVLDIISEKNKNLCGFNIKAFDIPYIVKKFIQHNIEIPKCLNFIGKKPWEITVLDIFETWKSSSSYYASLEEVAHFLNIENPKDFLKGSEIHDTYYNENNIEKIIQYCEKDILTLTLITKKILTMYNLS
jgi:3'-5' exonuclease